MKRLPVVAALCFATGVGFPTAHATPEPAPEPGTAFLRGESIVLQLDATRALGLSLGCRGTSLLRVGDRAHVACGEAGAVEVALGPPLEIVARRSFDAAVTGFFELDGAVWVRLARFEARPLHHVAPDVALLQPAPTPTPATPPTFVPLAKAPPMAPVQHHLPIVARHAGRVVVEAVDGVVFERGQHIEIFTDTTIDLGDGAVGKREACIAVGRVTVVGERRAEVELGLGERVPEGASARITEKPISSSRYTSRRLSDILDLRFAFRPFLAMDTVGFGSVNEIRATWRFDAPFALHATLDPAGVGFAELGNILALAGSVVASYDTDYFEIGLGLGWSAITGGFGFADEVGSFDGGDFEFRRVRDGFALSQMARLGSLDGIHLHVFNTFLFDGDAFIYGGTRASAQIPVADDLWLIIAGGAGAAGYAFGELGLRVLVHGNGDHGTLFLTPTLGGAGLMGETEETCSWDTERVCVQSISYAGPMVGIIVEYRP